MDSPPLPTTPPPETLHHLCTLSSPPHASNYDNFLSRSLTPPHVSNLLSLITFLYTDTLPLPPSRALFSRLITSLLTLPKPIFSHLSTYLLSAHPSSPRSFAFEPSLIPLRTRLADNAEAASDPLLAANILIQLPFDTLSSQGEHVLLRLLLRIARLAIAAAQLDMAETYLSRASQQLQQHQLPPHHPLRMQHRVSHAKLLYLRARFEDAAAKYIAISFSHPDALIHAVVCAILAPPTPRRTRLLASLYANQRLRSMPIFPLLHNVHMARLLSPQLLSAFRPMLEQHVQPDVVHRALIQHNLAAVSRLYANVSFVELGNLLDVTPAHAERVAATMIYDGTIHATIDQVQGVLNSVHVDPIERCDAYIHNLCTEVDSVVDHIVEKYPQFATYLQT